MYAVSSACQLSGWPVGSEPEACVTVHASPSAVNGSRVRPATTQARACHRAPTRPPPLASCRCAGAWAAWQVPSSAACPHPAVHLRGRAAACCAASTACWPPGVLGVVCRSRFSEERWLRVYLRPVHSLMPAPRTCVFLPAVCCTSSPAILVLLAPCPSHPCASMLTSPAPQALLPALPGGGAAVCSGNCTDNDAPR